MVTSSSSNHSSVQTATASRRRQQQSRWFQQRTSLLIMTFLMAGSGNVFLGLSRLTTFTYETKEQQQQQQAEASLGYEWSNHSQSNNKPSSEVSQQHFNEMHPKSFSKQDPREPPTALPNAVLTDTKHNETQDPTPSPKPQFSVISTTHHKRTHITLICLLDSGNTYRYRHFPHALQSLSQCWSFFQSKQDELLQELHHPKRPLVPNHRDSIMLPHPAPPVAHNENQTQQISGLIGDAGKSLVLLRRVFRWKFIQRTFGV